jgi:hypothetical protein
MTKPTISCPDRLRSQLSQLSQLSLCVATCKVSRKSQQVIEGLELAAIEDSSNLLNK